MTSLAQIDDTEIVITHFKSVPVLTTGQLADFYGTEVNNIQQNYTRNTKRFLEGKHFFKLEGAELKEFKQLTDLKTVSKNTRNLMLWTERGAARHAKMLDTDQAWDIFEKLEDCYFAVQEITQPTITVERITPEQAGILFDIVARRSGADGKLRAQMWGRLKKHFKYASYHDLLAVHFNEAKLILETMSMVENKYSETPDMRPIFQDKNVQHLMYFAPILGKLVRDELYPALNMMRSEYALQLVGLAQELATSANTLNRLAWGWGMNGYDQMGGQPLHSIEWYLKR